MKCAFVRLDINVALEFLEPAFELPSKVADVCACLHRALVPRYQLQLKDIQSFGGISYEDVKLLVQTFGGNGRIEIQASGVSMTFRHMSKDDIKTVRDFSGISEKALKSALPNISFGQRGFKAQAWLACEEDGRSAADAMLQKRGNLALETDRGIFAKYEKEFTLKAELRDPATGVKIVFLIERTQLTDANLFIEATVVFPQSMEFEAQFDEALGHYAEILRHLGLEVEGVPK